MSSEEQTRSVATVVHSAWDKLQAGDVDGALTLLASVEHASDSYSTYHVVLGSALLTKHDHDKAFDSAVRALELTPGSPHAKLIAEIAKERMQVAAAPASVSVNTPKLPRRTLAALLDPMPDAEHMAALEAAAAAPAAAPEAAPTATHFNIDKTADELTRERPLVRATPEPEHIQPAQDPEAHDAPGLVSETLAEIMIRQGKLTEAKKVYIQLSRVQPERYAHFRTKIEAIDKLLLGTSIAPETTTSETTDVESTDTDPVA